MLDRSVLRTSKRAFFYISRQASVIACVTLVLTFAAVSAFLGLCAESSGIHPLATFRTENLIVDNTEVVGPSTGATRVATWNGPTDQPVSVTNAMSEIATMELTGTGHDTSGDVCGVAVRNAVTFNTTVGPNQSCGVYGEVTSSRSAGANALINYAVRGKATGGTSNYAFYCDAGTLRCDDGASLGPIVTTGNFSQSGGTFGIGGTTTINGDTHITSHNLIVDTTGEFGGNLTADSNFRVNGTANLAGGAGYVYLQTIDTSGIPAVFTNALAPVPERITGSGAAVPAISTSIVTGVNTNVTLADGTKDGQIKIFVVKSGTGSLTPTHGTTVFWTTAPASIGLIWDNTATTWTIAWINGMSPGTSLAVDTQILSSGVPTVNHGSLGTNSHDFVGSITGIGANTSVTLTYSSGFGARSWCQATAISTSVALESIVVTSQSASAATFSCFNTATGVATNCDDFNYMCVGSGT